VALGSLFRALFASLRRGKKKGYEGVVGLTLGIELALTNQNSKFHQAEKNIIRRCLTTQQQQQQRLYRREEGDDEPNQKLQPATMIDRVEESDRKSL
jgi:hypothetical protein